MMPAELEARQTCHQLQTLTFLTRRRESWLRAFGCTLRY